MGGVIKKQNTPATVGRFKRTVYIGRKFLDCKLLRVASCAEVGVHFHSLRDANRLITCELELRWGGNLELGERVQEACVGFKEHPLVEPVHGVRLSLVERFKSKGCFEVHVDREGSTCLLTAEYVERLEQKSGLAAATRAD